MIETEQTVLVAAPIGEVWDYVQDIRRWANLMPGLQECEIIDADDSRWRLKVGVGGLVRTVNVLVHVDQWDGPERVIFSYKLEGDPVSGGGTYTAAPAGARETEITLTVRVEGGGSMAPMWEAMGKPLLPQFARAFAEQLKAKIEEVVGGEAAQVAVVAPSLFAALGAWLRNLWRAVTGSQTSRLSQKPGEAP